jgi:hypothetical protein
MSSLVDIPFKCPPKLHLIVTLEMPVLSSDSANVGFRLAPSKLLLAEQWGLRKSILDAGGSVFPIRAFTCDIVVMIDRFRSV